MNIFGGKKNPECLKSYGLFFLQSLYPSASFQFKLNKIFVNPSQTLKFRFRIGIEIIPPVNEFFFPEFAGLIQVYI